MKNLVVYYSYSGKTALAAQAFAAELGAPVVKLEDPVKPSKFRAYIAGGIAARGRKAWPIHPPTLDAAAYDRIFIGAPVWWGMAAPQINAYIDQATLSGKTVVVFASLGGNNPEEALKALSFRVAAKGGKALSSFSIKTGGLTGEQLAARAKELAGRYK